MSHWMIIFMVNPWDSGGFGGGFGGPGGQMPDGQTPPDLPEGFDDQTPPEPPSGR